MVTKLLLGLGTALLVAGGFLKWKDTPFKDVVDLIKNDQAAPADERTREEKSRMFEQWVVAHMSTQHHTLKNWREDQSKRYNAEVHPDMVVSMHLVGKEYPFAVECKWRNTFMGIDVDLTNEQITRYQRFALDRRMPIFLILGIGGSPSGPEQLFVIPLHKLKEGKLSVSALEPYKQAMSKGAFYYDVFNQVLSY